MASRKAHEVDAFLRRPEGGYAVYLVYGPNAGLANERARLLARGAVTNPDDPFQLVRLDGDEIAGDPLRLADEANTIGLFGGRRALWVRAGSRNLAPVLQPVLDHPPADAVIVVEAGDLQARNPVRAAVEASRAGMALPCYADEARDLAQIMESLLAEHRLGLDRDAREALLELLGPDRLLVRREIEKLAAYAAGAATVTLADVEAVMADAKAVAVDSLVDAVFLGQVEAVDRIAGRLFAEGEDPGVTVGAVLRHAMALHKGRTAMDSGAGLDAVERSARIFYKRKSAFQAQLKRWTANGLESAIGALREGQAQVRRQGAVAETLASRLFLTIALRVARSG
ncbi:MAG: DNA polymerase III subunit delta [Alsobacter sp.]